MNYLVDTHALLWWLFDSPKLSLRARAIMADRSNTLLVSSASAWEIATKHRIGKLPEASVLLQDMPGWIDRAGFSALPVSMAHAVKAGQWQSPHRDPFDRMIAAQSAIEQLPILGMDQVMQSFGVVLVW